MIYLILLIPTIPILYYLWGSRRYIDVREYHD